LWEYNNYILLRHDSNELIAAKYHLSVDVLLSRIEKMKQLLLAVREKRIHPGLDNKLLTSWNALMLKAYVDAYTVFDEQHYLEVAIKNANLLLTKAVKPDGGLIHVVQPNRVGEHFINGFLEDYCFVIEALIALYEATFDEMYLLKANELLNYSIQHFQDKKSGMFYFTSDEDSALISRKMELSDNVIPASNSSIAKSLFVLGHYFENEEYITTSKKMLNNILPEMVKYGSGYSNWAMLMLYVTQPFYEVAIVGKSVDEKKKTFNKHYFPNRIFVGSAKESNLPLLKNRYLAEQTLIYVCVNKTCNQPVAEVGDALIQIASE
jgi:uncharacterized protein YyaL (SSP411 family)